MASFREDPTEVPGISFISIVVVDVSTPMSLFDGDGTFVSVDVDDGVLAECSMMTSSCIGIATSFAARVEDVSVSCFRFAGEDEYEYDDDDKRSILLLKEVVPHFICGYRSTGIVLPQEEEMR